jgi:hypothetical protein
MSRFRRTMCVLFVVLAPAAALAQSDAPESTATPSEHVNMTGWDIMGSVNDPPGVVLTASHHADFDSLVRVERSFLSEIRDAAHAPSMQ